MVNERIPYSTLLSWKFDHRPLNLQQYPNQNLNNLCIHAYKTLDMCIYIFQ